MRTTDSTTAYTRQRSHRRRASDDAEPLTWVRQAGHLDLVRHDAGHRALHLLGCAFALNHKGVPVASVAVGSRITAGAYLASRVSGPARAVAP